MMKKGSGKEKCVIRNAILFTMLFAVLITAKPPAINAANPEWMFWPDTASATNLADDGEYIWVGTNLKWTYHIHKETHKYQDSILTSGGEMAYDKAGNLWIARGRLVKYDGKTTTEYTHLNSGMPIYPGWKVKVDQKDKIWIGVEEKGLVSFDGKTWTIYNSENSGLPKDIAGTNTISTLEIDKENNIWVSCPWAGLTKFDGINWTTYNESNSGLPSNLIYDIQADMTGNLWLATFKGIAKFDGENWTVYNESNTTLQIDKMSVIAIDSLNNIWFGTYLIENAPGLIKFDGENWTVYNTNNSLIKGNFIEDIVIDKFSNKWVSVVDTAFEVRGINIFREGGVILTSVADFDISKYNYLIYPNPVSESFSISEFDNNYNYSIFDLSGRMILYGIYNGDVIQSNDLVKGVYFIELKKSDEIHRLMFIKE